MGLKTPIQSKLFLPVNGVIGQTLIHKTVLANRHNW